MSISANSTKPRRNESSIVDLNKKNFDASLRCIVPQNKTLSLLMYANNGFYTSVENQFLLSQLLESELYVGMINAFDTMKIVNYHACVDISQLPTLRVTVNWAHFEFDDVQFLNNGVWTDINDAPAAVQQYANTYYPNDGWIDLAGAGEAKQYILELPTVLCCSASRAVPRGMNRFEENVLPPTYEDVMAMGNVVWQSKMPGSGVHLSFDIKAASNSERMMTLATDTCGKPWMYDGTSQQGRFLPTIFYGVKVSALTHQEAIENVQMQINNTSLSTQDRVSNGNVPLLINGVQYHDAVIGGTLYRLRAFGICKVDYDDQVIDPIVESDEPIVTEISIQGYTTCMFKQLRTAMRDVMINYNRIGLLGRTYPNGLVYPIRMSLFLTPRGSPIIRNGVTIFTDNMANITNYVNNVVFQNNKSLLCVIVWAPIGHITITMRSRFFAKKQIQNVDSYYPITQQEFTNAILPNINALQHVVSVITTEADFGHYDGGFYLTNDHNTDLSDIKVNRGAAVQVGVSSIYMTEVSYYAKTISELIVGDR